MSGKGIKRILIVILLYGFVAYSCKTHHELANENYTLVTTRAAQERGKMLVYSSCGGCHYNRSTRKFTGNKMSDLPKFIGKIYSANLTQSDTYGITAYYTNAQLAYLLKTGINRDGYFIPYMLRPNMADEDINAIIVYLRSNDPALAPADNNAGITHLSLAGQIITRMKKPMPYRTGIKRPDDDVANGRYLVDNLSCFHCHSHSIKSLNYLHPEKSKGYMQGGTEFKDPADPDGKKIMASNLTPGKKTGIGKYTKEQFRKAVIEGKAIHGRMLQPPMDKYTYLTEKDADNIFAYLHALPPIE